MEIVTDRADLVAAGSDSWKTVLKGAYRQPVALLERLEMPAELLADVAPAQRDFPLFCPEPFAARVRPGDVNDPIFKQIWTAAAEQEENEPRFVDDPLQESQYQPAAGLLCKYQGRALLVSTGVCAVHCRYCFRRHFPYQDLPHAIDDWKPALGEIASDPTLSEVILSGGDPFMMTDPVWARLLDSLEAIPQLGRLRIHTRMPVVIPERVTEELVDRLERSRLQVVTVLHVNHARELDRSVQSALARLRRGSPALLNQSVLLRGINDGAPILAELSNLLVGMGVIPYYLHQLDPVRGAAHFEVAVEEGVKIIEEMRRMGAGFLVPRFVREEPGSLHKTVLA